MKSEESLIGDSGSNYQNNSIIQDSHEYLDNSDLSNSDFKQDMINASLNSDLTKSMITEVD
jgi:hypothetical protein